MDSVWVEVFFFRILPVIALLAIGRFKKVYVFASIFILMILASFINGFSPNELGLNIQISTEGLLAHTAITIIFGVWFYTFARWKYTSIRVYPPETHMKNNQLVYFFISVPMQHFLAFGYLFPLLSPSVDEVTVAITMGTLFGFTHIAWKNPYFVVGTSMLGLAWAFVYVTNPSLTFPIISHCILATSITLGLGGLRNNKSVP